MLSSKISLISLQMRNFIKMMVFFSEYWYNRMNLPIGPVAVFPNLSGSSMLLTPTPPLLSNGQDYDYYAQSLQRNSFAHIIYNI